MSERGLGVPQDYKEAAKWYRLASDHGNGDAQYDLALMYAAGHGVPQDYKQAAVWYRKAADQGQCQRAAQFGRALFWRTGRAKGAKGCTEIFPHAAQAGNGRAQFNLATLYTHNGDAGIPQIMPRALILVQRRERDLTGNEFHNRRRERQSVAA